MAAKTYFKQDASGSWSILMVFFSFMMFLFEAPASGGAGAFMGAVLRPVLSQR